MAKKKKMIVARNAKELAEVLGLSPADALEWEMRYSLTERIIKTVKKKRLTVSKVAKQAKTSQARITNILKGNSEGFSIDVLLRVLGAVGQSISISFKKAA